MSVESVEQHIQKGYQRHQIGQLEEAKRLYRKALRIEPNNITVLNLLGVVNIQLKDVENSIKCFNKIISLYPNDASALFNRANVYVETLQYELAQMDLEKLMLIDADNPKVHLLLGNAYKALRRLDDAIVSYNQALFIDSNYFEANFNLGLIHEEQKNLLEAGKYYQKALQINPSNLNLYEKLINNLYQLERKEDAIQVLKNSLSVNNKNWEVFNNIGVLYYELNKLDQSKFYYTKSIEALDIYMPAFLNMGITLKNQEEFNDSIIYFQKALDLKPDCIDALVGLGLAHDRINENKQAIGYLEKALNLAPEFDFLQGMLLHLKMQSCDWRNFEDDLAAHVSNVLNGKKSAAPLAFIGLVDSSSLQQMAAAIWGNSKYPERVHEYQFKVKEPNARLRIGFFSSDFGDHPVTYLISQLVRLLDRNKFELYGFSTQKNTKSVIGDEIKKTFDHFIPVTALSDVEVVGLVRDLQIDFAIDLGGYADNSRVNIFAYRLAPIQISYLGFIGSMGVKYIDFIVADHYVVNENNRKYFSENIIYMPNCYQISNPNRRVSDVIVNRKEIELPEDAFVFCCFCGVYKILPEIFSSWMCILNNVQGSVLWLVSENIQAIENLKIEAAKFGVEAERLIFSSRVPNDQYLARYRLADLFLDTTPYNAGTVANDALWAGLPVLTMCGESFVSRMATSLLMNLGLPELITKTMDEYVSMAVELGNNQVKFDQIKNKLLTSKLNSPLFDDAQFAEDFESALLEIYGDFKQGVKFKDIAVKPFNLTSQSGVSIHK